MIGALGKTESFWGCSTGTDEVLVWRAVASGISPRRATDVLAFARAIGQANAYNGDVRAVVVERLSTDRYGIDVVMVPHYPIPVSGKCQPGGLAMGGPQDGRDLAEAVIANPIVRSTFPKLELTGYQLVELVGPAGAVDHWLAHSTLWSRSDLLGGGSATAAFAKGESVYEGKSDDGASVRPWVGGALPPVGPPPAIASSSGGALAAVAAAAVVIAGAWVVGGKRRAA